MKAFTGVLSLTIIALGTTLPLLAAERNMMEPRVPADKLAEARALSNPLPDSPDILEKGKALYQGKGSCVNCHGAKGRGDGVAAMGLNPSPRNFHHHGFWRHRSEGEIFWVIKHGIPGTAMLPFGAMLSDEEIWTIMQYERSFSGGPGGMMREGGTGGPGEPRGGREGMGGMPGGGRGGMMEGGCCQRPETER